MGPPGICKIFLKQIPEFVFCAHSCEELEFLTSFFDRDPPSPEPLRDETGNTVTTNNAQCCHKSAVLMWHYKTGFE